jgi:thymidylate synthase (FAD)
MNSSDDINNNSVLLLGHYGDDWTHACSAWTSTSRDLSADKKERMPQLLKMLATNGHHTPFEKSSLHFLVTADIASHIHFLKHRIAVSINAESARYKELKEDRFYIPNDWPADEQRRLESHCEACFTAYHETLERLCSSGLSRKRAKESARYYLPYAGQLQFDVMFNWRSFMHFMGLRAKPAAQLEIRQIAETMMSLIKDIPENPFQYSIEAFSIVSLHES